MLIDPGPLHRAPNYGRLETQDRVDAWLVYIEPIDNLPAVVAASALLGHAFARAVTARQLGALPWRALFAALHARRDALLAEAGVEE